MQEIRTLAVVTRYVNYRDNDRMLTLFSREHGKLETVIRGCRKPGSRTMAASGLFCYGEYMLAKSKGRCSVKGCDIRHTFPNIADDITAFGAAALMAGACEEAANPGEGNARLFSLLINCLHFLDTKKGDVMSLVVSFLLKLSDIAGYRPCLDGCAVCGREEASGYFSAAAGGLVCSPCRSAAPGCRRISPSALHAMAATLDTKSAALWTLALEKRVSRELWQVMEEYIEYNFEKKFRPASFLKRIARTEA